MTTLHHWLVSAPDAEAKLRGTESLGKHTQIHLPKSLKAGTLNSLMGLSDDLQKHDSQVEAVLRKFERQMLDLSVTQFTVTVDHGGASSSARTGQRSEVSAHVFANEFEWARNKYPERLSLAEINSKIHQEVMKADEDLRAKQADYNTAKSNLQTIQRRRTGTVAVRSLASLKLEKFNNINTENLVTVLAVIPKADNTVWKQTYATGFLEKENLDFFPVLFNSSHKIYEDDENSIWTVTVLRRKLGDFKIAVREKQPRWTVRDYDVTDTENTEENDALGLATEQEQSSQRNLQKYCQGMYGEIFRCYVHLKFIRLFVESCLRFGVPPDFDMLIIQVNMKTEKKLRAELGKRLTAASGSHLYEAMGGGDESMPLGISTPGDFFPYVYLPLNITKPEEKKK